jgi:hypothetical protein
MGHHRLGRLPKTQRWREVVDLLSASPGDIQAISRAVLWAAEERLRALAHDESLTYSFWLLTRITWAARQDDFAHVLSELGLDVAEDTSSLVFISSVADRLRGRFAKHTQSGPFTELASIALRRALSETIGQRGPSLFDSSVEDLRLALRTYSTQVQFGAVAHLFFGDFLARTLTYFLDKEVANAVGALPGRSAVDTNGELLASIDLYARQSARIARDFASGWYTKHNWQSKGEISQDEAGRFVAYALKKLRMELQQESD